MEILSVFEALISFVVVLSLVVIIHEGGHFIVARMCGVQVVAFSLGFGKKLWGRIDKKGTQWKICAVPLGGYVQMLGDEDPASAKKSDVGLTEEQKKHTFMAQKLWKRALIIFAGPFMNYFFAVVALAMVLFSIGYPKIPAIVGDVLDGSVAQQAGLKKGDLILNVDNQPIDEFSDLKRAIVISSFGKEITLTVQRDGQNIDFKVLPKAEEQGESPQIGVVASTDVEISFEDYSVGGALIKAMQMAYEMTVDTVQYLGQVLSGRRSADDMRGPIGIAEASGDAAKGGVFSLLLFIIQVSIGIGFVNLLPIPLLDGGHLAMYGIEAITRRPVTERVQAWLIKIGAGSLIFIFVYTLCNDVPRLFERMFG